MTRKKDNAAERWAKGENTLQRKETQVAEAEAKTLGLVRLRAAQTNGPGEQAAVPPDWGALISRHEDGATDAGGNGDDSRKHQAEREAAHAGRRRYHFTYMTLWTTQTWRDRNKVSGFRDPRVGLGGRGDGNILCLDGSDI